jgi:NADH-quinone oxidoreductase subunit L
MPALQALFANRWYLDRLYRRLLDDGIYRGLSRLCAKIDQKVIDAGLDELAGGTVALGRMIHGLHAGMIQYKLLTISIALGLLGIYLLF